jgi:hypothetical protein
VSGYTNPDPANQRLSDAERDAAVGRLAAAQAEGRLTATEYEERATSARSAVTRGDLLPLFADLPEWTTPEDLPPRSTASTTPGTPTAPGPSPASGYAGVMPSRSETSGGTRALGGRVGATIMALTPFLAVGLFFLFGFNGSFAWSWLWFLLIPIAGIVIYGPGSEGRRSQR